jgi:predicted DNA-binding transcriptional regulator YafY
MSYRGHEFPQKTNNIQSLVNNAIEKKIRLRVLYQDLSGQETERELYCYLRQDERTFVISGIKKLEYVTISNSNVNRIEDSLETWKTSQPEVIDIANKTKFALTTGKVQETFTQISTSSQWNLLLRYYRECINREFLQKYITVPKTP